MVAFNFYDPYREGIHDGNPVNFETPGGNGIKCALHTNTYTPAQNTDDFFNDATNEVTGTGYTPGGNVMSSGTVTLNGSGVVTVDLNDPATWAQNASGFNNAILCTIYRDSGTATTSELIGYSADFSAARGNVDGDFSIALASGGLFTSSR